MARIGSAEPADKIGFDAFSRAIEDRYVETALNAEQCGEQANRAAAGDEDLWRFPAGSGQHPIELTPRAGHDACRFDKDAKDPELVWHLNAVVHGHAIALAREPVRVLDAMFGELTVSAAVPLTRGTAVAGDGIGHPNKWNNQVSGLQARLTRLLDHSAKRFVSDHESRMAGRRRAVLAVHDFSIGSADAERDGFDQEVTL